MALSCKNQVILPFSATFTVPKEFNYQEPDKFSIAISTDNLNIFKSVVEETVETANVVCDKTINNLKVKIGQINVSGVISYRVAANGIQSDELIIDPILPSTIPSITIEPAWSSADGIVSISDTSTANNYITVAYVPVDEDIIKTGLKVYLYSMELKNILEDGPTDDKVVTIGGAFKLVYMPN